MASSTATLKDLCVSIGEFSETIASLVTTEDEKAAARIARDAALPRALSLYAPGRRTFEIRRAALHSGSLVLIKKIRESADRPIQLAAEDWDVILERVTPEDLETLLDGVLDSSGLAAPLFRAIADGVPGFRPIYLSPLLTRQDFGAMLRTDPDLFEEIEMAELQAEYLARFISHAPARAAGHAMVCLERGDFRGAVMFHLAGAPINPRPKRLPRAALQRAFLAELGSNHGLLAFKAALPSVARHLHDPGLLQHYLAGLLHRIPETS